MVKFAGFLALEAMVLFVIFFFGAFVSWELNPAEWSTLLRFVLGGAAIYVSTQVVSAVLDD